MPKQLPDRLKPEQAALESQVRAAFRGVTRAGSVSWSETDEIDWCRNKRARRQARARDRDRSWEVLVDDAAWKPDKCSIGGFAFLDPIGYRYYLAPAMVRSLKTGSVEFLGYALHIDSDYTQEQCSLLTPAQRRVVARFVRFMIAWHSAIDDQNYGETWSRAYVDYWKTWDVGTSD
jgi:hypothetical protein